MVSFEQVRSGQFPYYNIIENEHDFEFRPKGFKNQLIWNLHLLLMGVVFAVLVFVWNYMDKNERPKDPMSYYALAFLSIVVVSYFVFKTMTHGLRRKIFENGGLDLTVFAGEFKRRGFPLNFYKIFDSKFYETDVEIKGEKYKYKVEGLHNWLLWNAAEILQIIMLGLFFLTSFNDRFELEIYILIVVVAIFIYIIRPIVRKTIYLNEKIIPYKMKKKENY